MSPNENGLKRRLLLLSLASILSNSHLAAQDKPEAAQGTADAGALVLDAPAGFDALAGRALLAMKGRAEELKIKGVALVAYAEGDRVKSWSSKMLVVGNLSSAPSQTGKGNNFLGIAYSKAAEMADTLKDSGSGVRPPMTGEYGWQGGVVARGKSGILIAAFSGGRSEDDVKVSQAGLGELAGSL